jgi:prepilin peptidase CpaA
MDISIVATYIGSVCFVVAALWAGVMDVATMKIKNELVLFLLATYAAFAPLTGMDLTIIGWNALLASAVLVTMFTFFSFGWIGGGDAKLVSVAALWIGPQHIFSFLVYTAVIGGALTLLVLQFRMVRLPADWQEREWLARLHQPQCGVPYGVAIAAGALAVFPGTPWIATLP